MIVQEASLFLRGNACQMIVQEASLFLRGARSALVPVFFRLIGREELPWKIVKSPQTLLWPHPDSWTRYGYLYGKPPVQTCYGMLRLRDQFERIFVVMRFNFDMFKRRNGSKILQKCCRRKWKFSSASFVCHTSTLLVRTLFSMVEKWTTQWCLYVLAILSTFPWMRRFHITDECM
jgi:hypothetical protein